MKKKIFTIAMMCLGAFTYTHAQYNLFDAADVDADGWIWFDTQAKIDKYIGQADNENAKYDEGGKLIQLVAADIVPDYPESEASVDFVGAGTDGELNGPGAKTGAIKTAASSANMTGNGGGFIVKMPSCTSFNIMLSADSKMYARLLGTTDANKLLGDYTIVSALYTTVFKPLSSAGQKTWVEMEKLNSGNDPIFDYESASTMYAYFQSFTKNDLYIHGMKILTSTPTSGIGDVENDSFGFKFDGNTITLAKQANVNIYNLQGMIVKSVFDTTTSVNELAQGAYLVKVTDNDGKSFSEKISVR